MSLQSKFVSLYIDSQKAWNFQILKKDYSNHEIFVQSDSARKVDRNVHSMMKLNPVDDKSNGQWFLNLSKNAISANITTAQQNSKYNGV